MSEEKPKPHIVKSRSAFGPRAEVDLFLRIHRHLPDAVCGDAFPFGPCEYSPLKDKAPINAANESVIEKRKDPAFVKLERVIMKAQNGLTCPYCGNPAEWVSNEAIYGRRFGKSYMAYYCKPCDAYVHCHQNTRRALGTMANRPLREARIEAHRAIDPLWKKYEGRRRGYYRRKVYARLAEIFDEEVHIGEADVNRCRAIVAAVKNGKFYNL